MTILKKDNHEVYPVECEKIERSNNSSLDDY